MVQRMACPLFANFLISLHVDQAVWLGKTAVELILVMKKFERCVFKCFPTIAPCAHILSTEIEMHPYSHRSIKLVN